MQIPIPEQVIPAQVVNVAPKSILIPLPSIVENGVIVPQAPLNVTIQIDPITIPAVHLPAYTITVPDPSNPVPIPQPLSKQLYAPTSFWNSKASLLSLNPNSANFVSELWASVLINAGWINASNLSVPLWYADQNLPLVPIYLLKEQAGSVAQEILNGVRIPKGFHGANGGDGHACIIDTVLDKEYDFWQLKFNLTNNRWETTNAGILENVSKSDGILKRLPVWNSATACHLPLAGGLILKSELEAGVIPHVLAMATLRPKKYPSVVAPALTTDGYYDNPNAIPEGARFRFPQSIVINPNWTPLTKMMVMAVRDYGMVSRDTTGAGVTFYVQDPTQFGLDDHMLDPYLAGKHIWDILGDKNNLHPEFPWASLEAVGF